MNRFKFILKVLLTTGGGNLIVALLLMLSGFGPLNWINEQTTMGQVCYYTGLSGIFVIIFLLIKGLVRGWFNTAREEQESKIIEERKKWY